MYGLPNFSDFYQKPLIPIGENDRLRMINDTGTEDTIELEMNTHWLIALEGSEKEGYSPRFHWKVVMFPSNQNGSFNFTAPLYVSPFFTFNEAVDYARQLENSAKEDQFFETAIAN